MPTKTINFSDAVKFAKENGYLLAVYKKEEDNYNLVSDSFFLPDDENDLIDAEIIVKTTGAATDFNEFTTADKKYYFRLHNNFNIPKIIPIFYHCSVCYNTISTEQHNSGGYCPRCVSWNK